MLKRVAILAIALTFASGEASACLQLQSTIRDNEIALLDKGLDTFKLTEAQRKKALELRRRSEALSAKHKADEAMEIRHSALIAVGYTGASGPAARGAPEPQAAPAPAVKLKSAKSAEAPSVIPCGASPRWIAPPA